MRAHTRAAWIVTGLLFGMVAWGVPDGRADQIEQRLMREQGCQNASTLRVSLRDAIEQYVDNAESMIEPPSPVGDLGCLDQLMQTDIAFEIQVPDLQGMFAGAVTGAKERLCQFAMEKWNEVTQQLQGSLEIPGFTDNFGLINIPGFGVSGGVVSSRGSLGSGGSGGLLDGLFGGGSGGSGGGSGGGLSGGGSNTGGGEPMTADQLFDAWRQLNGLQNSTITQQQREAFEKELAKRAEGDQVNLDQSVLETIQEQNDRLRETWNLISGGN
ncbi:hypothetical protein [Amorphus sp. 3PC139-8]|uniref:hypothetical protein n=1 Tax=Amorphus sp. 3PC139-8 TaxID=2735676 RepID=UPI00345CF950